MDANKIIDAFINVVQKQDFVFDDEAINDIPALQKKLASVEQKTIETVYEVLRSWYINHETVRDAVLIEEREISKVKKASANHQENILENRDRILEEELQKLYDNKKQSGQEQKPVN